MSFHLGAYYQSQAGAAGVLQSVNAVADPILTVSGIDIRVPKGMENLLAAYCLDNDATVTRAQLQSPSLRALLNLDIEPITAALVFGSLPDGVQLWESPIPLIALENLEFYTADTAVAHVMYGLVIFGDGPVKPVSGKVYIVRATGAATLAAGTWVNTALTFSQTLPAGHYQVVGFRPRGTNLVAARLVFVGGTWRPGIPAINTIGQSQWPGHRAGKLGVWGEFDNTTPPTVDCLGVTDTAQVFELELIKTG